MNLFNFTKVLLSSASVEERWNLIQVSLSKYITTFGRLHEHEQTIPPSSLQKLFQTSLEPPVLILLLQTFLATLDQNPSQRDGVREYMDGLANVPRFSTVLLLLTNPEKDCARRVWEKVGVDQVNATWRI